MAVTVVCQMRSFPSELFCAIDVWDIAVTDPVSTYQYPFGVVFIVIVYVIVSVEYVAVYTCGHVTLCSWGSQDTNVYAFVPLDGFVGLHPEQFGILPESNIHVYKIVESQFTNWIRYFSNICLFSKWVAK